MGQQKKKEITTLGNKKKNNDAIKELKKALGKEHRFYSNINIIRFLIRISVFILTTVALFLFDVINLNEMFFIFLALLLVEYLRSRKNPDKENRKSH